MSTGVLLLAFEMAEVSDKVMIMLSNIFIVIPGKFNGYYKYGIFFE